MKSQKVEELSPRALKGGRGVPVYNIGSSSRFLVFFFLLICFDPAQPFPFSTRMSYFHLWFFS